MSGYNTIKYRIKKAGAYHNIAYYLTVDESSGYHRNSAIGFRLLKL